MFCKCGYTTPKYTEAMLEKERVFNTYLGNGVSIPHGVEEMRSEILNSGVVVLTSRDGIDWGNGNKANLIVGVASVGDEHMKTLQNIALHCGSPADVENIVNLDVDGVYDIFKG